MVISFTLSELKSILVLITPFENVSSAINTDEKKCCLKEAHLIELSNFIFSLFVGLM